MRKTQFWVFYPGYQDLHIPGPVFKESTYKNSHRPFKANYHTDYIVLGLNTLDESDTTQKREVAALQTNGRNLVVLKLKHPFKESKAVKPIDLCSEQQEKDPRLGLLFTGFGKDPANLEGKFLANTFSNFMFVSISRIFLKLT